MIFTESGRSAEDAVIAIRPVDSSYLKCPTRRHHDPLHTGKEIGARAHVPPTRL